MKIKQKIKSIFMGFRRGMSPKPFLNLHWRRSPFILRNNNRPQRDMTLKMMFIEDMNRAKPGEKFVFCSIDKTIIFECVKVHRKDKS